MNAVVISCASCSGEFPVGTKPVVGLPLPDVTTTTTAAAMAITTATTAAMMTFRFLPLLPPPPCRACLDGGPAPITGIGEVEGSDAYHGPDDLLPPESLVTHGKVPTRKFRHKRSALRPPGQTTVKWRPLVAGHAALPGCPANLLEVTRNDDAVIGVFYVIRIGGVAIALIAIGLLARRWLRASPPQRDAAA